MKAPNNEQPALVLVSADAFPIDELAALFTNGYEGYYAPIAVDGATLSAFIEWWDVDLTRSRVALVRNEPVGIANLAIRGNRAWVAGLGVVPAYRRSGIGRALMKAILAQAPRTVTLEVIDQNEPAIALYKQLGFETQRTLEVWTLNADLDPVAAEQVAPEPLGQTDLPWQRADSSLPHDAIRLNLKGGAVILRTSGSTVSVLQLQAHDLETAAALITAARAHGDTVRFVNVAEGDIASDAFAHLGATLQLRQLEMLLRQ